ncbi:MAG: flagellar biosynthesis protein FlaG [Zetaproteobacteria bacterium]|nr:MAG: flagellar biosynthesis protein FlaG [Zetaproteobacteria bacterium]
MEAISSTIQNTTVTPTVNVGALQTSVQKNVQPQPQVETPTVSEKEVQKAIQEVSSNLGSANVSIGFSYEKKLGQLFVLVTDSKSGEVIREVPSKDFIKHKLAMQEMIGLLLDKQV